MRHARLIAAILCPILLAACGHSPEPIFLTLDYTPAVPNSRLSVRPFRVGAVRVPPMFDRPELARETEAGKVRVDGFALWSAPIDQMVRRTITEDLLARLPAGSMIYPDTANDAGSATVTIDMLSLVERNHALHLVAGWAFDPPVEAERHPRPFAVDRHLINVSAHLNDETPQAMARSLSALCGLLADDIAAAAPGRR